MERSTAVHNHQPLGLDQIDDLRFPIPWLAEANSPLPDEKWPKL